MTKIKAIIFRFSGRSIEAQRNWFPTNETALMASVCDLSVDALRRSLYLSKRPRQFPSAEMQNFGELFGRSKGFVNTQRGVMGASKGSINIQTTIMGGFLALGRRPERSKERIEDLRGAKKASRDLPEG